MMHVEITDAFVIPTADLGDIVVSIGLLPIEVEAHDSEKPKQLTSTGVRFSHKGDAKIPCMTLADYWDWNAFPADALDRVVRWFEAYHPEEPELFDDILESFESFLEELNLSLPAMHPGLMPQTKSTSLRAPEPHINMSPKPNHPQLPPWFTPAHPYENEQGSLFKVSLESALAQAQVSPDELNRWHSQRWISFAFVLMELNEPDDPKILELQFVRDVVRSGLTDAQITHLFDQCPKPHSFDPERTAFSFRYGLVQAIPPVEPDEPETVIEAHLDSWIEECDEARLTVLHDQIVERLNNLKGEQS